MEGNKTIFVGNLPWITTDEDLRLFMSQAGTVVHSAVQRYEDTHRSKGWALVEYSNPQSANQAIILLDRKELNGRQVHLRLDRSIVSPGNGSFGVYVGNLAWAVTERDLLTAFAPFKPIACQVLTNMYGRSRGFAIVKFSAELDAILAIQNRNEFILCGRPMECRNDRGPARSEDADSKNSLYVGKLSPMVRDDDELLVLFRHIGPIVSAKLQRSANGASKGWGIIKFQAATDAKRAVEIMNGAILPNSTSPLEVRFDRK